MARIVINRIPTRVHGLDTVLNGGLLSGGLYLFIGGPGTGKTVLASEICYRLAESGERALFFTTLAESHGRLLSHTSGFSFFDDSLIQDSIRYLSASAALTEDSPEALRALIMSAVHEFKPRVVVIDNLEAVSEAYESRNAYKQFLHSMSTLAGLQDCIVIGLVSTSETDANSLGQIHADGVLKLTTGNRQLRSARELYVSKFRGSGFLEGRHLYTITGEGVHVYPRTEALYPRPGHVPGEDAARLGFGIETLDRMLKGGFQAGTTTLAAGATGTGKTVLGLHFLAEGARRGEPGIYLGFNETVPRIIGKGKHLGLPLDEHVARGALYLHWEPLKENLIDAISERLIELVEQSETKRLVIDGVDAFRHFPHYAERLPLFFAALSNELRALGVTTYATDEVAGLTGTEVQLTMRGISGQFDNLLFLRHVEYQAELKRLLSIIKMREGDYDPSLREFQISGHGIELAPTFESARRILTGMAEER